MPEFDVDGARQAGYSDDDILSYLGANHRFDVSGARAAGYSLREIIDHVSLREIIDHVSPPAGRLAYKQETARRTFEANKPIPTAGTGIQRLFESINEGGSNLIKGIGNQVKNWGNVDPNNEGSPDPRPMLKSIADPVVNYFKSQWNRDPDSAATAGGRILTDTLPAVYGGYRAAEALAAPAANLVTSPTALRVRATNLLEKTGGSPTDTIPLTKTSAINAAVNATRTPRANLYKSVANAIDTPEGRLRSFDAQKAAGAEEHGRVQSLQPVHDNSGMVHPSIVQPPGVSAENQAFLDSLRSATNLEQRSALARENAYSRRLDEPPVASLSATAPATPVPPPMSATNTDFLEKARAGAFADQPAVLDAPTVNKWMGIPAKEVMHGANPGMQVLEEKLVGPTKEITKANVDTALKDAGQQMKAHLEAATKSGVTIDAQTPVYDAHASAVKRIGTPRDATFNAQMDGIVDDIEARYPDLSRLSPTQTHALKVELGDSITWKGANYDSPANQAMIQIYRDLNKSIKTSVPGIDKAQTRWGNLYVASRNLSESMAGDVVGKGSGALPPSYPLGVKPPKTTSLLRKK